MNVRSSTIGRSLLVAAMVTVSHALASTGAPRCGNVELSDQSTVTAPEPAIDSTWSYVADPRLPVTELKLLARQGRTLSYEIAGRRYDEDGPTYTDILSPRRGVKTLLRFPMRVGDRWEDEFAEVGEYRSPQEHYEYQYEEKSQSVVWRAEEIEVPAGRFATLLIRRTADWRKSNPRPIGDEPLRREGEADEASARGTIITQMWYAPAVGRVVLRASLRVVDANYARATDDLRQSANAAVTELVSFSSPTLQCSHTGPADARLGTRPIGYALDFNNTWKWALRMREHRPRQVESSNLQR